jgi:hypothetical protein
VIVTGFGLRFDLHFALCFALRFGLCFAPVAWEHCAIADGHWRRGPSRSLTCIPVPGGSTS